MNVYLAIILAIILGQYFLELIVESSNIRHAKATLPEEFSDVYSPEDYKKSQNYLKEKTRFSLTTETILTVITILFILSGGFNFVDQLARSLDMGPIPTGLVFSAILLLAIQALSIPFAAYHTFTIEAKYGFNKTTIKTFILDRIKSWIIAAIILGIAFCAILWFFEKTGGLAWFYCWIGLTLMQLFLVFIAPVLILPLFNKYIPLEQGDLKQAIEDYAKVQNFKLQGIFKMDGSRRSTKSNAFFTGFGKFKRIALFDTLIEKHTTEELVSVIAHEIGHYSKKHIIKDLLISILTNGLMLLILSKFINNPGLFAAFRMEKLSIYASLFFFSFLYTPINLIISILGNVLSRKHEFEADAYAIETYGKPQAFIAALKKLSVNNLSNLTPHPLKVFLEYSHPPVLQRIRAIKQVKQLLK